MVLAHPSLRSSLALSFWVLSAARAGASQEGPLTRAELVERARALVEAKAANGDFSGAVLVADGDEVLLALAAGEACKSFHVANDVAAPTYGARHLCYYDIRVAANRREEATSFGKTTRQEHMRAGPPRERDARDQLLGGLLP